MAHAARDLIKRILQTDPKQRYSIQDIRKSDFFKKSASSVELDGIVVGKDKIPVLDEFASELTSFFGESELS